MYSARFSACNKKYNMKSKTNYFMLLKKQKIYSYKIYIIIYYIYILYFIYTIYIYINQIFKLFSNWVAYNDFNYKAIK